jgi:Tol biopolymer transport system component
MADDAPRLLEIAAAVSDGRDIDWVAAESAASTDAGREVLRGLKVLARVGALHRSGTGVEAASPVAPRAAAPAWGPFHLVERIGGGRFGDVYRAWDPRLDRDVALKLLSADRAAPVPTVVDEARLLARVRHPNVITVHGADVIEGRVGLWMEYIRGTTLAEAVGTHGPFGAREAASIGIDLCRALAAVHSAGLVHRDIKPQNVMREAGGRIVLMDFGAGGEESSRRVRCGIAGTPLYLAPELFDESPATVRSDIYSLGVLLYFLVTGTHPVTGDTAGDLRARHTEGTRRRLRDARADLPAPFVDAVERALDPDPAHRYDSAGAFEAALAGSLESDLERTPRDVAQGPPVRKRRWWPAAAAVAVVLSMMGGLAWWRLGWTLRLPDPRAPGDATTRRIAVLDWPFASVSPDGRWLVYQLAASRHLWLKDLAAGTARPLIEEPTDVSFAWSGDSRQIAFASGDRAVVRVETVTVSGGIRRTVWAGNRGGHPDLRDWTPDGQHLVCMLSVPNAKRQIALLALADGSLRPLLDVPVQSNYPHVSPDGRLLAYAASQEGKWDVFVAPLDGSAPARRVGRAGTNMNPVWSRDGRWLIFSSDRGGETSLWGVPLRALGQPASVEPTLIAALPSRSSLIAATAAGELVVRRAARAAQVCLLRVDAATGTPSGDVPACLEEATSDARWSPDGHLYFTDTNREGPGLVVVERDLATQQEQVVRIPRPYIAAFPAVSPSGITFYNGGGSAPRGLYEYVTEAGRVLPLWTTDAYINPPLTWSPDRRSLIFAQPPLPDRRFPIRVLRRGETAPRTLAFSWSQPFAQWSPDGRYVAYNDRHCLMIVNASGGEARSVVCEPPSAAPTFDYVATGGLGWAPDGRTIAWGVHNESAKRIEIWFVDVATGRHASWPGEADYRSWPRDPRWSPDGRSLAFTKEYRREIEMLLIGGRLPRS